MNAVNAKLTLDAFALAEAGPFRANNEDVVLARPELGLFVVADGMGGRPDGERAAARTVELFAASLSAEPPSAQALLDAFRRANDALYAESMHRGLEEPMAAVATVAWLELGRGAGRVLIGHVGDTRALLFDEEGAGCQLTRDQAAVDADRVPESEALAAPGRNVVARALGLAPWSEEACAAHVEIREVALEPGCTLVLVSDGVTDYLDRARTAAVAAEHKASAERLARALVAAAIEAQHAAGAGDNIGVVVVRRKRDRAASAALARAGAGVVRPSARVVTALAAGAVLGLLTAGAFRGAERSEAAAAPKPEPAKLQSLALETCDGREPREIAISIGGSARVTIAHGAIALEGTDVRVVVDDAGHCTTIREGERKVTP